MLLKSLGYDSHKSPRPHSDLCGRPAPRRATCREFTRLQRHSARTGCQHPRCNARIAEAENELVIDSHVHLGIAIATGADLVVPAISNAEKMSARDLDTAIADLARRGKAGQLDLMKDMRPSTFVVSNTGGLEQVRVIATTPIVSYPTVAMLWISRINQRPWIKGGSIVVANVLSMHHGIRSSLSQWIRCTGILERSGQRISQRRRD